VDATIVLAIGNEALALLGAQPVSSIDEGSDLAATLTRVAPTTIAKALTVHPWACTIAQVQLARLADPPGNGYRYAFALPVDRLNVLRALASPLPGAPSLSRWRVVEDKLHADAEAVWADIQRVPPLHLWSPHVRSFVSTALAARLAQSMTGSNADAQFWAQCAWGPGDQSELYQARRVEAQQHTLMPIEDWPLIAARWG
jgi:hypothetical protein